MDYDRLLKIHHAIVLSKTKETKYKLLYPIKNTLYNCPCPIEKVKMVKKTMELQIPLSLSIKEILYCLKKNPS